MVMAKRKQHKRRKAAKETMKEVLAGVALGIASGLALLYAIANDPYQPPEYEEPMIQAIGGDYYYPASAYDQYLAERQAYIDAEAAENEVFVQSIRTAQERQQETVGTLIKSRDWDAEESYQLAKMAMAEAEGEDTEGKALVMLVILNRVWSDEFPDTIAEVIAEDGAFTPYSNGRYDSVEPDEDCWGQWS